jgi:hypothetical protein
VQPADPPGARRALGLGVVDPLLVEPFVVVMPVARIACEHVVLRRGRRLAGTADRRQVLVRVVEDAAAAALALLAGRLSLLGGTLAAVSHG